MKVSAMAIVGRRNVVNEEDKTERSEIVRETRILLIPVLSSEDAARSGKLAPTATNCVCIPCLADPSLKKRLPATEKDETNY
jgi:hypothetical protein